MDYLCLSRYIKSGQRFVCDYDIRLCYDGSGDSNSLSLPAGKFVWFSVYNRCIQFY